MAEPLSTQLNKVADEAWTLELKTALSEINALWNRNVYSSIRVELQIAIH